MFCLILFHFLVFFEELIEFLEVFHRILLFVDLFRYFLVQKLIFETLIQLYDEYCLYLY